MKTPVRNSPLKIEQMRTALIAQPHTYDDLTVLTGLSKQSVALWVKHQKDIHLVHISGYSADTRGRLFVPQFSWGNKPDAPRPGCQRTAADRMRDMRARRKATS